MKTLIIRSKLGADRLADTEPGRDAKRGGTGEGRLFKREVPMPETAKELTVACDAFNEKAEKAGWDVRIDPVKLYEKAVSLLCQAEMNARAFAKHGKKDANVPQSKGALDLSGVETI